MDERDFLHDIANRIQVAKVSLEIGLERYLSQTNHDPRQEKVLRTALEAVNDLGISIRERRNQLLSLES